MVVGEGGTDNENRRGGRKVRERGERRSERKEKKEKEFSGFLKPEYIPFSNFLNKISFLSKLNRVFDI